MRRIGRLALLARLEHRGALAAGIAMEIRPAFPADGSAWQAPDKERYIAYRAMKINTRRRVSAYLIRTFHISKRSGVHVIDSVSALIAVR
jgi:hypothetical protein